MKTKLTTLLASCMLLGTAVTAMAVPLPVGPVTFHWTNYEERVTGVRQELKGVFSLDQITQTGSSTPVWSAGDGGKYLYGKFDSLIASSFGGETPGSSITFTGGNLYVYEWNSTFDLTKDATIYTDINSGNLFLSAQFVTGGDFFNPTSTLVSTITGSGADGKTGFLAIKGSGASLLDVTGGSAGSALDTNSYARFTGGFADLAMVNTFSILNTGSNPFTNTYKGWDVVSSDPINGIATPEPGTFALLGAGLIGLGLFGRKRMRN